MSVILSVLMPTLIKSLVDFTACVQFRCHLDLGGAYYTFTLFSTIVLANACAQMYDEGNGGLSKDLVITIALASSAGMIISYSLLLASINSEYVITFYDATPRPLWLQEEFIKAEGDDERQFDVVGNNEKLFTKELRKLIRECVVNKFPVWLEEQPVWFDDYAKSKIPAWALEGVGEDVNKNVNMGRRASLAEQLGDALMINKQAMDIDQTSLTEENSLSRRESDGEG